MLLERPGRESNKARNFRGAQKTRWAAMSYEARLAPRRDADALVVMGLHPDLDEA
jgi:hypothetical protein